MFPNAYAVAAKPGDVRGSRLLTTDRAADLQSGSPPGDGQEPLVRGRNVLGRRAFLEDEDDDEDDYE
jgi:hypothetical protein